MDIKDKVQKEMERAEMQAAQMLADKFGMPVSQVSIRNMRPTDIEVFTSPTGTSKTMGENTMTVATGTTENTLSTEVPNAEYYVIEGLYLPAVTGIVTDYVAMYIGDNKERWYRGAMVTGEPNSTMYFDDPFVVKGGDRVRVRFLTTSDGNGTGAASATHPIMVLGKVLKAQG